MVVPVTKMGETNAAGTHVQKPQEEGAEFVGDSNMCTRAPKVLYTKLPDQVNME